MSSPANWGSAPPSPGPLNPCMRTFHPLGLPDTASLDGKIWSLQSWRPPGLNLGLFGYSGAQGGTRVAGTRVLVPCPGVPSMERSQSPGGGSHSRCLGCRDFASYPCPSVCLSQCRKSRGKGERTHPVFQHPGRAEKTTHTGAGSGGGNSWGSEGVRGYSQGAGATGLAWSRGCSL